MAERGWTPGPWQCGTVRVHDLRSGQDRIADWDAVVYAEMDDEFQVSVEGPNAPFNARLIAAAPELYEALENLVRLFEIHTLGKDWKGVVERLAPAKAALAKARGE